MTFTHIDLKLPEYEREVIDGTRYYKIHDKNKNLVSITSVISDYNKEFFKKWRQRVGEEEANRIVKQSTERGTSTHSLIESYLLNQDIPEIDNILSKYLFLRAKPILNRINNIYCIESSLVSDVLGVAGTVDTIAEFDNELAVIDYKTSKEPKPVKWITSYFVQAMFYGMAFYEMTGIKVKKLVIIMMCENGECVVYEERDLDKYMKFVVHYIKAYVKKRLNLLTS